jgi:hypothetical protein
MDFYYIAERPTKDDAIELYPDFKVGRSKDLMIRAKSFYAIWDEKAGLWSTDEYDVQRLIDEDLFRHKEALEKKTDKRVRVKTAGNFSSGIWQKFRGYMALVSDSSKPLDEILTFSNTSAGVCHILWRRVRLRPGPRSYPRCMTRRSEPSSSGLLVRSCRETRSVFRSSSSCTALRVPVRAQ